VGEVQVGTESFWRVFLKDPLPELQAVPWIIGRGSRASIDFYHNLVTEGDVVHFEVEDLATGELLRETETVIGTCKQLVQHVVHTRERIGKYLDDTDRYILRIAAVHRRRYMPLVDLVVSIPHLQERIAHPADQEVLRENIDYYLSSFRGFKCLQFMVGDPDVWQGEDPPRRLWAETTYLDNRQTIEANFGIPAQFSLEDLGQLQTHVDYLSAVRGIWYAHFWGPTVRNLRIGTQILLGLPFAEKSGVIEEIRTDFGSSRGRILVRDEVDDEIVRFYTYPNVLSLEVNPATGKEYVVGDYVTEFAPLVAGVEVTDYINNPTWFAGHVNQGVFYEVEKYFRFLVRVDSAAFSLASLMFVRDFLLRVKPTYTYPMFVVLRHIDSDPIDVHDSVHKRGTLHLQDGLCRRAHGSSMTYDDWRASWGGYVNAYDSGKPVTGDPVYPTPHTPIRWGYDKLLLCPNESIHAVMSVTYSIPTIPTYDSIFTYDTPVLHNLTCVCPFPLVDYLPGDKALRSDVAVCTASALVAGVSYEIRAIGSFPPGMPPLELVLYVNDAPVLTQDVSSLLSSSAHKGWIPFGAAVQVNAGDSVRVSVQAGTAPGVSVPWMKLLFWFGEMCSWSYDTPVPAGTYYVVRLL